MANSDIRWKQRFQNFDRAFDLLCDALKEGPAELSLLEQGGSHSAVRIWVRTGVEDGQKDYLETNGVVISPVTPRQVLKEAFAAKVLEDGQVWIDMLDHRNLLSHTYDSVVFEEAVDAIAARYLPAFGKLHAFFEGLE